MLIYIYDGVGHICVKNCVHQFDICGALKCQSDKCWWYNCPFRKWVRDSKSYCMKVKTCVFMKCVGGGMEKNNYC